MRDVGLDVLHAGRPVRVEGGIGERAHERRLPCVDNLRVARQAERRAEGPPCILESNVHLSPAPAS